MRVLLVQPAIPGAIGFEPITRVEPLALELLAGALAGFDVRLVDLRTDDSLEKVIRSFRPQLCGLTCGFTIGTYATLGTAMRIKAADPTCFVLVGGHHASMQPDHFYHPAVDAVCVGEGEETIRELTQALADKNDIAAVPGLRLNTATGQVSTGEREQIADLDRLPLPRRDLVKGNSYYFHVWHPLALLETTRGCPQRCSFCSVWNFYRGTTRRKSATRVLAEITAINEPKILISDDNFFADVERSYELAELVRRENLGKWFSAQVRADTVAANPDLIRAWHEAGLRNVFLGLEAITDDGLRRLHKNSNVEQADRALRILHTLPAITITGSFIVDPSFSRSDFTRLKTYVREHGIHSRTYTVLTPLPGTPLFRQRAAELLTGNCTYFDLLHSVLPTRLPPQTFTTEFAQLYRSAYVISPRTFLSRNVLRTAGRILRGQESLVHSLRILQAIRLMLDRDHWALPADAASIPAGMPSVLQERAVVASERDAHGFARQEA